MRIAKYLIYTLIFILVVTLIFTNVNHSFKTLEENIIADPNNEDELLEQDEFDEILEEAKKAYQEQLKIDPLNLSFMDNEERNLREVKILLSTSELGICSEFENLSTDEIQDYRFYYRLKDSNEIVYTCIYKGGLSGMYSTWFRCEKGDGYDDYINGNAEIYRLENYFYSYTQDEINEINKRLEDNLNKRIEIYCKCNDAEELYELYPEEFDESWEEAYDFFERYCE